MIASVSSAPPAYFRTANLADAKRSGPSETRSDSAAPKPGRKPNELTPSEKVQVEELKRRDAEVRAHERAHLATAGSLAMGGPSYVYQTGPDGKNYAIGGSVKIDTSPGRTPEESLRKSQQIRAAAGAPSDPSPQDIKVAAAATTMATEARTKLNGNQESDDATDTATAAFEELGLTSSRQIISPETDSSRPGSPSQFQLVAQLYQQSPER